MKSVVCTLFEGHYHYGLAALTNSLYQNGFRGHIYAGYRGDLPKWSLRAEPNLGINWPEVSTFLVEEGLFLHFVPVQTTWHLTNYKPQFMLELMTHIAVDADAIAYFDPDIVVKCRWSFYDEWILRGVALVHEVVANDMPATHPLRIGWKEVALMCNKPIVREIHSYLNAGFCGVVRSNLEFLQTWTEIIHCAIEHFDFNSAQLSTNDRSHLFHMGDQDALNIAAMCAQTPISEMGPEGMDFVGGGWTMSHAAGSTKPWKKNYLLESIKGCAPTSSDRSFWDNVAFPVRAYNSSKIKSKQTSILFASFVGRFYRKY